MRWGRAVLGVPVVLALALVPALRDAGADGSDHPVYPLSTYPAGPNDNAVLQWNEEALQCVRTGRLGPPVVARALYIGSAAMYDAWAAYDGRSKPTVSTGFTRRPSSERTAANKRQAISHAAHVALSDVFPACRAALDERLAVMGYAAADTTAAAVLGRTAGQRVIDTRRGDGANQAGGYADTTGYQPVNTSDAVIDPWRWQPLRVPLDSPTGTPQTPMTPHWGRVIPFNPATIQQARQVPKPSRKPEDSIDDIIRESAQLDDRKKTIVEYWADGPRSELPPGHWNLFAQWLSRRYAQSIDADARMFLALNGAMLDASIGAWHLKYRDDFVRPLTAIRAAKAGQTIAAWGGPYQDRKLIPGETWRPYQSADFPTPPFPEHVSGHSTFSSAGAAVLKDFGGWLGRDGDVFGASVTIPAGSSRIEPPTATHQGVPAQPVTLSWPSFTDAASEAGLSRRYGGIHWIDADRLAQDLGKKAGEAAFSRSKKLWEGG